MNVFARMGVLPLAAIAFVPVLFCQTRLTLADAVSQALAENLQLAVAAARVNVAEGLRIQAGLSPNPRLIVQLENTRFWETPPFSYTQDTDTYAFLAQTFETGGKRGRRVELAAENVHGSELDLELQRRQIVSRVSTAYWSAAGAARVRDLFEEETADFDRVVQLNRDRVREGAIPEVDLLRIEVERDRLAASAAAAAQEADRARIALFREMGKREFPPVEFADPIEPMAPVPSFTPAQVLEQRVEMKLAREGVEAARANLRLQQANAKVDPDIHFGYERFGGFDTIYMAAQIPLPIHNRNQGQIESAAAGLKEAQSSVTAAEAVIRSELESATIGYEFRRKLLSDTLQPMRARADEVYRIVDAAYRETGSDILRLLDAERTRIETEIAYARALAELQQSAVALETAQGSLP
jgi:outer membrane protein, heavy metal efflux system